MLPRGRPKKSRIVKRDPRISQFSPRGRPGRPDEIELQMDEFEAIRLVDFAGLKQKEAASSMNVSQQTISRILKKARKLIADAIINGKAIKIAHSQKIFKNNKKEEKDTLETGVYSL